MLTVTVDASKAIRGMESLYDAVSGTGADAATVVAWGSRQLAKRISDFMPPLGPDPQAAGEHAIDKELGGLPDSGPSSLFFTPRQDGLIAQVAAEFGNSNIDAWREDKDGTRLHLLWQHIAQSEGEMAGLHNDYRDRRTGTVPLQRSSSGTLTARVVVEGGLKSSYIGSIKDRVGRWKATWLKTAKLLGQKRIPPWISRHFGSLGSKSYCNVGGLQDTVRPYVVFGSRARGGYRMQEHYDAACKAQARNIKKLVERILAGHKNNMERAFKTQALALSKLPEGVDELT